MDVFLCGAAGPALEGGEVLFGMRANPGAIERITVDPFTLNTYYGPINNIKPRGNYRVRVDRSSRRTHIRMRHQPGRTDKCQY